MKNIIVAALLLLGYTQAWATNPPYHAITLSTPTGTAFENLSGYMGVAGSSLTFATYTILMDGVTGGLNASSFTAKYGVFAGTFTTPNGGNVTTSVVIGAGPSLGGTGSLSFTEGTAGATQTMQFGVINIKTDTQNTVILGGGTSLPTNIRGYQDGTSTMSVILQDGGGNVGIRTTSPGSALDDNGDATIRGQETVTSTLTVQGVAFSVGGSSFVVTAGSVSIPYQLVAGSINMSGSSSTITTASSVTASAFFGDGSHLAGIPSTASITSGFVAVSGSGMTGPLTMLAGSTITISGNAFSVGGSSFVISGGSETLAYQSRPGSISMTGSTGTFTNQSSVTASGFFGDGAHLTGIPSTASINAGFVAVGVSTLSIASGGATTYLRLNGTSTMVGQIKTSASGILWADGSITTIAPQGETSFFLPSKTFGSSVTIQGGDFSYPSLAVSGSSLFDGGLSVTDGVGGFQATNGFIVPFTPLFGGPYGIANDGEAALSSTTMYGQIAASPSGILWADGSISTTASSGSGAGETSYFGPSKTFGSSVTVSGSAFSVGGSSFVVTAGSVSIPYRLTVGSLNMTSGSTIAATNGMTLSTSPTSSAFQIDNTGMIRINGNGAYATDITTSIVTAAAAAISPLMILKTTSTATGTIDELLTISNGSFRVGEFTSAASLPSQNIVIMVGSGTAKTPQAWLNAPTNFPTVGQFVVQASTGGGASVVTLTNEVTYIENGGSCSPGSTCILPTGMFFRNNNQAGSQSVWMNVTSTGEVTVGGSNSTSSDPASVKFRVLSASATVDGQLNIGWEQITNACGAGVTTCTATCSSNKVLLGGGCNSLVSLTGDSSGGSSNSWTCSSAISTITAYVTCARLGP